MNHLIVSVYRVDQPKNFIYGVRLKEIVINANF